MPPVSARSVDVVGFGASSVDYVTIVLSPALIFGLVGSLVLFLLEVCYRGEDKGNDWKLRLQLILSAYVFGAVLVSRISMMSPVSVWSPTMLAPVM